MRSLTLPSARTAPAVSAFSRDIHVRVPLEDVSTGGSRKSACFGALTTRRGLSCVSRIQHLV